MPAARRRAGKVTTRQVETPESGELFTLTFELERETKGAVRYIELGEDGEPVDTSVAESYNMGTFYIRKAKLADGVIPERLVVAIAVAPAESNSAE